MLDQLDNTTAEPNKADLRIDDLPGRNRLRD
jgi:hypothetical protein